MDRKLIFCVVVGFVCLYQPAKASIIRHNEVSDFGSLVDESMADSLKKIKMIETKLMPELTNQTTWDILQSQLNNAVAIRAQEFLDEINHFYINLKEESVKSGVLPDMNKNMFDLKLLELLPKYMDFFYTDVVAIIINEPRLYEEEKLTVINELLFIFDIIKTDIFPKVKKEIVDSPQEWTRIGLLGTMFSFSPDELPLSKSEMAAEMRFYSIVHPYEPLLRAHSENLEKVARTFFKRVRAQKGDKLVDTDEQNNAV